MQDAKNFGLSLKNYLILKYLHNLFEVDEMMYVLKIKHMLKLLLNMRISKARVETLCTDLLL